MLKAYKINIVMNDEKEEKLKKLVKKWNARTDFEHGEITEELVLGDLIYKFFDLNDALDKMLENNN